MDQTAIWPREGPPMRLLTCREGPLLQTVPTVAAATEVDRSGEMILVQRRERPTELATFGAGSNVERITHRAALGRFTRTVWRHFRKVVGRNCLL